MSKPIAWMKKAVTGGTLFWDDPEPPPDGDWKPLFSEASLPSPPPAPPMRTVTDGGRLPKPPQDFSVKEKDCLHARFQCLVCRATYSRQDGVQ